MVQKPLYKLCKKIKKQRPHIPIVVFARGLHPEKLEQLVFENDGCFNAIGLGQDINLNWAAKVLQPHICIQGNLDPAILLTTPEIIRQQAAKMLSIAGHQPGFIVNLGHGILPTTPIENVQTLVDTVVDFRA